MNDSPMKDALMDDRPIERSVPAVDAVSAVAPAAAAAVVAEAATVAPEPASEAAGEAQEPAAPVPPETDAAQALPEGLLERVEHAVLDAIHSVGVDSPSAGA